MILSIDRPSEDNRCEIKTKKFLYDHLYDKLRYNSGRIYPNKLHYELSKFENEYYVGHHNTHNLDDFEYLFKLFFDNIKANSNLTNNQIEHIISTFCRWEHIVNLRLLYIFSLFPSDLLPIILSETFDLNISASEINIALPTPLNVKTCGKTRKLSNIAQDDGVLVWPSSVANLEIKTYFTSGTHKFNNKQLAGHLYLLSTFSYLANKYLFVIVPEKNGKYLCLDSRVKVKDNSVDYADSMKDPKFTRFFEKYCVERDKVIEMLKNTVTRIATYNKLVNVVEKHISIQNIGNMEQIKNQLQMLLKDTSPLAKK